ncbi:trypsin-4-like [Myripristis murdjan]|uniref:trypsin-4-like n=1 Tax=Myripristis murdjan TaxID=586833 RepID=UPI001175DF1A|nr:trypsin-4-like [Myripristis murdjan]
MSANLTVHHGAEVVPIPGQNGIPFTENGLQHDIILVKLPNLTAQLNLTTIPLPDCANRFLAMFRSCVGRPAGTSKPCTGDPVQIAGHGATWAFLDVIRMPAEQPQLQCANVSVVDCVASNLQPPGQIPFRNQHYFCGQAPGVDACDGDSGGGVVYKGQIYGVISGSGRWAHLCPIRFMDVCHADYRRWIKQTTGL